MVSERLGNRDGNAGCGKAVDGGRPAGGKKKDVVVGKCEMKDLIDMESRDARQMSKFVRLLI